LAETGQDLGARVNAYESKLAGMGREIEGLRAKLTEAEQRNSSIPRELDQLKGAIHGKDQ
jgi:chromosome segregation ATPase